MAKDKDIADAARAFVLARYRLLREAHFGYGFDALNPLLEAEERLYEAVSGETDLIAAARALGCKMAKVDQPGGKGAKPPSRPAKMGKGVYMEPQPIATRDLPSPEPAMSKPRVRVQVKDPPKKREGFFS